MGVIAGLALTAALLAWGFLRSGRIGRALSMANDELEASRAALAQANAALADAQVLAQAASTSP